MTIIIPILFLFLSLIALAITSSIVVGLIRTKGVPFISTPKDKFDAIIQTAELKPGQVVFDLGCGRAGFLIYAAKKAGISGVGFELTPWPYAWGIFDIWRTKTAVKLYMRDFFKTDLKQADVVYCYLFPEIMAQLELKFEQEMRRGTKVVSYGFKLPNRQPDKVVATDESKPELGRIYVYEY